MSQQETNLWARELQERLEAEAIQFSQRPEFQGHLGYSCLKGLKQNPFRVVITDTFLGDKSLNAFMLLGVGLSFAHWMKREFPEKRIGIVLPPGLLTTVCNLGTVLAGKIPVNLNFTAGRLSNESAIRRAELKTILTAEAFVGKVKDFPWTDRRVDIPSVLQALPKAAVLIRALTALLLPSPLAALALGVPTKGGDAEAALLFTSGSSGEPKGVVLTHRNLISNVRQISMALRMKTTDSLLGCLPTFHSFGFTVTVWYPIIGGPRAITHVSPLDTLRLAEIIQKHQISLVVTTPTFLRGFMKRATREQFQSVKKVVTGAEKLPVELAEAFEQQFNVPIREGYGLTETSPVISVNLLDRPGSTRPVHRRGSTGRPVPGVAVRVSDPETGSPLPVSETGLLSYAGANIFAGYLGDPERTADVLKEGWFSSGDLGRLDQDGFLYIEGRLTRFSKIGGEMVPHGTIEQRLEECFPGGEADSIRFMVSARPNVEKGEELVVLSTATITVSEMAAKLRESGMPNLWIPKIIHQVDAIPQLASGKLDLASCRKMVADL